MKTIAYSLALLGLFAFSAAEISYSQPPSRRGGGRGGPPSPQRDSSSPVSPVAPGEAGIAWYSTWDVAKREAIRSNRPILFMSAASQCGGVPGVF